MPPPIRILKKLFDIGRRRADADGAFPRPHTLATPLPNAPRWLLARLVPGWVTASARAFFGALIAGLIGGIVVHYLKKIPVHKVLRSVMPIFVIPIVGTFITAGIMMWGAGRTDRCADKQPDPMAARDAAGQHRAAGGDHGADAGF